MGLALHPPHRGTSMDVWSHSAAIIEHVRDGSVVRALLLPDYYLVTVMLSGIKVRFGCWGVGQGGPFPQVWGASSRALRCGVPQSGP